MHSPHLADSRMIQSLRARPVEDVVYQAVTVGAILVMLGSFWIF